MVSGALLVLLVLQARVVLMELLALSDQRAIRVLPDPRVGLDHKGRLGRLGRRVTLENAVLLVSVERSVLLALLAPTVLPVPLVLVWIMSGPSR